MQTLTPLDKWALVRDVSAQLVDQKTYLLMPLSGLVYLATFWTQPTPYFHIGEAMGKFQRISLTDAESRCWLIMGPVQKPHTEP